MKDLFEGVEFEDIYFNFFGKRMVAYAGGIGWWIMMLGGAFLGVFGFAAVYIALCALI